MGELRDYSREDSMFLQDLRQRTREGDIEVDLDTFERLWSLLPVQYRFVREGEDRMHVLFPALTGRAVFLASQETE